MKGTKKFLVLLVFFIFFCQPECKGERKKKRSTESVKMLLIYFGNIQGELEDCGCSAHPLGGIARRVSYVSKLKEREKAIIQVDSGNVFASAFLKPFSPSPGSIARARVLAKAMSKLEMDAINIGENDLRMGINFLKGLKDEFKKLNFVSSNLVYSESSKPVFSPYRVIERRGIRVGIFGLMSEPGQLEPGFAVLSPELSARTIVNKLRGEEKVDLVVGLFELQDNAVKEILSSVSGIDIVVSGKGGLFLAEPILIDESIIVDAGSEGKYLGELRLDFFPSKTLDDNARERRKELRSRLELVEANLKLLNGEVLSTEKDARDVYFKYKDEAGRLREELERVSLRFNYVNHLVPMEPSLEEDKEVKGWVEEAKEKEKWGQSVGPHH